MVEDAPFRCCGKAQILWISRVEIENGGQLHDLGVGHAVAVNRSGGKNTHLRHVGVTRIFIFRELTPGILGQFQQGRVAGTRIRPQHSLHIGNVSHRLTVVRLVGEEVLAQCRGNVGAFRIGRHRRGIGEGSEATEQHVLWPTMKIAHGIFKELRAEIPIGLGVRERVVKRGAHLRHQFFVFEHKGQSCCSVEPIGLLLPRPPRLGRLLACPISIAERPGDLRKFRTQLRRLLFEPVAQPTLGPHGSGSQRLQCAVVRDARMRLLGGKRESSVRQRSGSQQPKAKKLAAVPRIAAKARRILHAVLS